MYQKHTFVRKYKRDEYVILLVPACLFLFFISNVLVHRFQQQNEVLKISKLKNTCESDKWVVITSIFEPTELVFQIQNLSSKWCAVVVGDKKGPPAGSYSEIGGNVVFIDVYSQHKLGYKLDSVLLFNHFGRKNIGYLYAIQAGAKIIYDTDDDNYLKLTDISTLESLLDHEVFKFNNDEKLSWHYSNVYKHFVNKTTRVWPRGFPLEFIDNTYETENLSDFEVLNSIDMSSVGVIQYLANHDPDIDAIYRMTKENKHFDFTVNKRSIILDRGIYTPFNAQATLFTYDMFWALYLPVTVTGRVSDIWRSYIAQRVMWDIDRYLIFSSPIVKQCRNAHNYLKDFQDELDLYTKTDLLIGILDSIDFTTTKKSIPSYLVKVYKTLVKNGILENRDFVALTSYVKDLERIGYRFPQIKQNVILNNRKLETPTFDIDQSCIEEFLH